MLKQPRAAVFILVLQVLLTGCAGQLSAPISVTKINEHIYTAIGATEAPAYENWGHNNNLSFVIGRDAVLVVNSGDNYLLAKALHAQIRRITSVPVLYVSNENGQGHAFLGNSYWAEQEVSIIAHRDAIEQIKTDGEGALLRMRKRSAERAAGTRVVIPTESFDVHKSIDLGGLEVELRWFGNAHSPGDISVWIPQQRVLIAGDIAFHERMLGVFPETIVTDWIASFEAMSQLDPEVVIPGHGAPTNLEEIRTWTYDYLRYLVSEVTKIIENEGDLADAYKIDQSAYQHLDVFTELAVKNAGRVYQALELEMF